MMILQCTSLVTEETATLVRVVEVESNVGAGYGDTCEVSTARNEKNAMEMLILVVATSFQPLATVHLIFNLQEIGEEITHNL